MLPIPPNRPFQLFPLFRERVWGRESLAPYFPQTQCVKRIGEAWFTFEENPTSLGGTLGELIAAHPAILGTAADHAHPGICPLLVKLLFTTERLSVQVHPDDEYARQHHGCLGKTEAWYVLEAEPGAEVAVGFQKALTPDQLKSKRPERRDRKLARLAESACWRCDFYSGGNSSRDWRRLDYLRNPTELGHHLSALRLRPAARTASRPRRKCVASGTL